MSQLIETKFEYNEASYEFDVRDADQSERLEKALDAMKECEKKNPKDGKASAIIRAQCNMIKRFFDDVFGDGAGNAVCTEKSNLQVCYDAYEKFLLMVREQKESIVGMTNVFAKYSNRQQRRAAERAHK